jgi:hypothetical protein
MVWDLNPQCKGIDLSHSLKLKIKVCPTLQLTNGGHKTIFVGKAVLGSIFRR